MTYEVSKVNGAYTKICGKLSLKLNIIGIEEQLVNQKLFKFFKHKKSS
jgi:hypothetical protein